MLRYKPQNSKRRSSICIISDTCSHNVFNWMPKNEPNADTKYHAGTGSYCISVLISPRRLDMFEFQNVHYRITYPNYLLLTRKDDSRGYLGAAFGLRTRSVRSRAPIFAATMKSFSVSPPALCTTKKIRETILCVHEPELQYRRYHVWLGNYGNSQNRMRLSKVYRLHEWTYWCSTDSNSLSAGLDDVL